MGIDEALWGVFKARLGIDEVRCSGCTEKNAITFPLSSGSRCSVMQKHCEQLLPMSCRGQADRESDVSSAPWESPRAAPHAQLLLVKQPLHYAQSNRVGRTGRLLLERSCSSSKYTSDGCGSRTFRNNTLGLHPEASPMPY